MVPTTGVSTGRGGPERVDREGARVGFRVAGVEHSDGAAMATGRLNLLVVHDGEREGDGTGFARR